MLDLFSTADCEPSTSCAGCGTGGDLGVQTATTAVGVICLTLCPQCTDAGVLPRRLGMAELVTASLDHCVHLGITSDQMDAAMTPTRYTILNYGPDA